MTGVRPPLDLEAVLVGELEQDVDFAPVVGGVGDAAAVATRLPAGYAGATTFLRVSRDGGGPVGWPDHVDRAIVTFHAYGPSEEDAWHVAAELVAALARLEGSTVDGGVVTAADRLMGPAVSPDPDLPAAERYLVQYGITAHPA